MKNKLELYGSNADEETNLFNRKSFWCEEDSLDEKYLEYLSPYSKRYYNRLRSMFSFEVKTLESLNLFSHVLFRDGILFLIRFFQIHPCPKGLRTQIIIHETLASIVPQKWRGSILYYKTCQVERKRKRASKLVVGLNLSAICFDVDQICSQFESHLTKLKIDDFFFLPISNVKRGEDFLSYDKAHQFNLVSKLEKIVGANKVYYLDYSKLGSLNFDETDFYHIQNINHFVKDSFIDHEVLAKAGSVVGIRQCKEAELVMLSPYHGIKVMAESPFYFNEINNLVNEQLEIYERDHFDSSLIKRESDDFFKIKYYDDGWEQLAYQLMLKIEDQCYEN